MNSFIRVRALPALSMATLALVASGLALPAEAATSTGKVQGVVSLNGTPVDSARVQLYERVDPDPGGDIEGTFTRIRTVNTDSDGRYSFAGLKSKKDPKYGEEIYDYSIAVSDRSGTIVRTGRAIDQKKGRTVTKNLHVKAAAILTGVVTTADGRSPAGLTMGVPLDLNQDGSDFSMFYPESTTTVRSDGRFVLAGLPASSFYDGVYVADGRYAKQCYDFVTTKLADCAPADPTLRQQQRLAIGAGEVRALPSVQMTVFAPPTTRLTGKVTDTSGRPLKGIAVDVNSGPADDQGVSRSSGRFTIASGLPAGPYGVRFYDPKNVWAAATGRPVVVVPGQPIGGLDVALKSVATVKTGKKGGRGTAKIAVMITRKASGSAPGGTLTVSFGEKSRTVTVTKGRATVTLTGLPAGTASLDVVYSGTASTAGFAKKARVAVE
ncbi:carboxypeptidase regulatory-like domain-containing protein [Aeromicrobium fastidiosum]|nr:carboxypeptidase regulatory-like domain-containing protein [Aeromicrobium fastidiosum]MBP2392474.1 protocatechuate 3,4-dioxygenase beta subunit [Aeromicrobium fastidiosum]